jgi:mannose-1-phosphate guanylyltransferase
VTIEAILLVGGAGTRLRPLTVHTPKPMLPVAGVPLVVHQLTRAREAGVDRLVLATSYRPEVFRRELGDGGVVGLEVEYVTEEVPLGTAGALRNVADRLTSAPDDPVWILNGDIISGHDMAAQLLLHQRTGAAVTLHLTEVADPRPFGVVPTDRDGRVSAFLEKTAEPAGNQINAGCYLFRREVLDRIPPGRPVSVERETFPHLLDAGAPVYGYLDDSYWLDLGTPAAFVAGSRDLVLGLAPSPALPGTPGPALVLPGASVAADATVDGGSCVGAGARVDPAAVVDGSVVFPDARIGRGAVVRHSAVGRGAVVGDGTRLDEVVVGDGARIGAGNELLAGLRVWPDAVIGDRAIRFSTDA